YGGTSQGAVDVGNYTIMPSGQSSTNYTISYVSGNLGISAAPLEIIADSTSKSFGTLHTFTGNEFISTGLRGVETIGSVTLTSPGSTATATVAGSPYAIVASAATGGSFIPTNYAISYTNGTLTVTPAGLLGIVANPASKVYDGLAWKGGNGVSYSGFQGSDTAATLSGTLTYGGSSQGAIDVGNYTIIPAGQSSPNYTITYVNSILGITPAPLAILANSSSKVYGSALGFTGTEFTSTGLQGAETIGAVSLSSAGAAAAASVAGGPYTIVPGAAGGGSFKPTNYTISYVDGSLNVTPAPLMVLADSQSKTFGTPDPQLSFRVTGLLNNPALGITDTAESVLTGALARRAGETVSGGPYAINSGTLTANSNYTMGFTPATLGITGITVVVAEELAEVNAVPVIFAGVIHNVFYYRPGNFWHISLNSNDADQGFDVMRGTGTAETRLRRSLNRCDSVSGSGFCETWTFPQQQDNDE
ncbi:MAG: MBG domain-containing protein, partial [Gammaproteobacteria bacterium]|nr:MBG domain-containing protein [Gammaproteobacteria bacterium]